MGPPRATRDWGTTEERGGSVVRANEDEDGRSVVADVVGPPAVGGRLPRPLLDDGRGALGSASSAGEGRNDWPPLPSAVGDGCWWCCCWRYDCLLNCCCCCCCCCCCDAAAGDEEDVAAGGTRKDWLGHERND